MLSKTGSLIILALRPPLEVALGVDGCVLLQPARPGGQFQVQRATAGVVQAALPALVERVALAHRLDVVAVDVTLRVQQERRLQVGSRTAWDNQFI